MSLPVNDFIENFVVIILCAGEGHRMNNITKKLPKPLIKIPSKNDKPILQISLECLKNLSIENIFIVKGHLGHLIDEFIVSHDEKIGVIDSKEEYKKGPLNSFMEGLKSQIFQNKIRLLDEKGIILVMPGDTIFDSDLLREILRQIRKHINKINKYPLVFYRTVNPNILYRKQYEFKLTKKIPISVIEKNHPSHSLKRINQINLEKITNEKFVNQLLPLFIFPTTFCKVIFRVEPLIKERTIRALLNEAIKLGEKIYTLKIQGNYLFHDIDEIADLTRIGQ